MGYISNDLRIEASLKMSQREHQLVGMPFTGAGLEPLQVSAHHRMTQQIFDTSLGQWTALSLLAPGGSVWVEGESGMFCEWIPATETGSKEAGCVGGRWEQLTCQPVYECEVTYLSVLLPRRIKTFRCLYAEVTTLCKTT